MGDTTANSVLFLNAFVQIEMYLRNLLNNPSVGFVQMVHMGARKDEVIRHFQTDLVEYAQLRNAIVHNRGGNEEAIAEPHDSVVTHIQSIVSKIQNRKTVMDLVREKPFSVSSDMLLLDMVKQQKHQHYSAIPVYNNHVYVGVVHPRLYQRLMEDASRTSYDLALIRVEELLQYYQSDDRVVFVPLSMSIPELLEVYETNHNRGKSVIAIIVTETGKQNEKPFGIFTVADLPILIRELE